MDVGPASASSYDRSEVSGANSTTTFESGSSIHFILDNGFVPTANDSFDFLSTAEAPVAFVRARSPVRPGTGLRPP